MIKRVPTLKRSLRVAAALIGASAALGGCTHTNQDTVTGSVPNDYRQRHPIVIQEANRTTEVFVGSGRGGLTAAQRAEIMGLAQAWLREGTGGIVIDVPVNTPNARVATDSLRDIQAILNVAGVPSRGINVRNYRPTDPRLFATIRVNYPRIAADAGPCGLWPEDIGPSIKNKGYLENRPYHNFGCSTQRNLAAMIDNPSDLVQPRSETPPMTARRNVAFAKYRKGEPTTTVYPENDKAKLSDAGK
ncbi:MAG: CpaD family pilus assembly protein [Pseudomonadota bacterium]